MDSDLILLELSMLDDPDIPIYEDGNGGIYKLYKGIEVFIKKLINTMKAFGKRLKLDIDNILKERNQSKKFKETILLLKANPDAELRVSDLSKVIKLYQTYMPKFQKELREITKKEYKKYNTKNPDKNLDGRIANFNEKLDEFEKQIDEINHNEFVVKKGADAVNYLQNIQKGVNPIFHYYNSVIHDFDAFVIEAEKKLQNKMLDVEKDEIYLVRSKGLLQRFSNKTSSITRKVVFRSVWYAI